MADASWPLLPYDPPQLPKPAIASTSEKARPLSDIASRLETTERSAAGAAGTVEENLKSLTQRVDAADKRQREAVSVK